MVGFKLQLRVSASALAQLDDVVQLMMFDGGYIGAIIVEDEIVTIGWVMHRALLQRIGADWPCPGRLSRRQSPLLAELLDGAKPRWDEAGRGRGHSVRLSSPPGHIAERSSRSATSSP